MAEFKDRLKELRISKGWSQDVLADKLQITRSAIGNYEQGKRIPEYEQLEAIADLFNVDMKYLMGKQDVRKLQLDLLELTGIELEPRTVLSAKDRKIIKQEMHEHALKVLEHYECASYEIQMAVDKLLDVPN